VIFAASVWGLAVIAFGLSPTLPLALLALAVAGGADMISGVFRSAIWNGTIPDALRGRLAGIEMVSYTTGPAFGDLEAGTVATLFSVRVSVVSGGVLCVIATVLLALVLPGFRQYDARSFSPVSTEEARKAL
jgi:MFS family permease